MHNLDTVKYYYNTICSLILMNSNYVDLVSSDEEDLKVHVTDMTSNVAPSIIHVAEPSTTHVTQTGSANLPWYI